jgi:hypothetical protein
MIINHYSMKWTIRILKTNGMPTILYNVFVTCLI